MPLNDDIADALVKHDVGLQRLSNATVRKIVALLNRSDRRIFERLLADDIPQLSKARQNALLSDIRRIVQSVYEDATGPLQIDLERLGQYEVEYQGDLLDRTIPVDFNTIRPSENQILAAVNSRPFQGRLLREWYQDLERGAFARLRNGIRAGIVEGRTTDQMVRELRGTRAQGYKDGILQVSRRAAEVTVRTAGNHTATEARGTR